MRSRSRRIFRFFLVGLATLVSICGEAQSEAPHSRDVNASAAPDRTRKIDERVNALLRTMTLAEKIGQLQQVNTEPNLASDLADDTVQHFYDRIRQGQFGSILNEVDPSTIDKLQRIAIHESRAGVPLIFGRDVIHGFRTVFPIPLGQAATWNPQLVETAAAVSAREARSVGINWTFAPMVDIARDPRWGRIAESLGEDPFLASSLAAAMVRGYQGSDLSAPGRIAACAKHFAGYGACEGGRDYNSAVISPSLMRNVYLPPFHAAVDAGVATLMTSFNTVNSIPGSANEHLLRDVLRKEWKFRGFVVSDWKSIGEMIVHGYCRNEEEAARAAVRAGVNMEMVSHTYHDYLPLLIKKGDVSEALVDNLVAEVLRVKLRLGLFEHPFVDNLHPELLKAGDLKVARQLARQSIVLLKNDRKILPLDGSKLKRIAIIGPLADANNAQLGTWALDGRASDSRTPLAALRESAPSGVEVVFAPGLSDDLDRTTSAFDGAVAVARKADVVLLIVGEGAGLSGEAHSRAILDLPGAQNALVDAIVGAGKPIVLVVEAGRPLTIGRQVAKVDAVLYSFHSGTMAGPALADLIWGIESPSGKLPVTFPKVVGQIPLYYNHTNTGRPPRPYEFPRDSPIDDHIQLDLGNNSNYIDVGPYPLYPFGYGLSYTAFQYGHAELSTTKLRAGETVTVRVPVTNTGKRTGTEVAQLYVRNIASRIVRPIRELKGFQRIRIDPGESKRVEFSLSCDSLCYFDSHEGRIFQPGQFEVYIGGASTAPKVGEFEVGE